MGAKDLVIHPENFVEVLDKVYEKVISKVKGNGKAPAINLAEKYMKKYPNNPYKAALELSSTQKYKTFSTGFISSFGGFILLPVTLPADLTTSLFIELNMIAAIAHIGGHDIHSEEVKSLSFMCLLGSNGKKLLKSSTIKMGKNATNKLVAKVPQKALLAVNKKVGVKVFTKIGAKGTVGISRGLPIIGGFIGGGMNIYFTKGISKKAMQTFILNDMSMEERTKIKNANKGRMAQFKEKITSE